MKDRIFIIIEMNGKAYDYPKNMPIPRVGEYVRCNAPNKKVIEVSYTIEDTFKEIRIILES